MQKQNKNKPRTRTHMPLNQTAWLTWLSDGRPRAWPQQAVTATPRLNGAVTPRNTHSVPSLRQVVGSPRHSEQTGRKTSGEAQHQTRRQSATFNSRLAALDAMSCPAGSHRAPWRLPPQTSSKQARFISGWMCING